MPLQRPAKTLKVSKTFRVSGARGSVEGIMCYRRFSVEELSHSGCPGRVGDRAGHWDPVHHQQQERRSHR